MTLIYNVDYVAVEGTEPKVIAIRGYPTEEGSAKAKLAEGAARLQVRQAGDLNALGPAVLLAVHNYKAKKPAQELPADVDVAIWDMLQPRSRKEKKSAPEELQSDPGSTTSSSTDADDGESGKEKKMATKKAVKKGGAKSKARKASAANGSGGPRGEKTLKVKGLLERKSGCTRADILKATGWPAVSVQQMARACGLKLRKEKEKGKPLQYFGS